MLVAKGPAIAFAYAPANDGSEDGITFDERDQWLRTTEEPAFEQSGTLWNCNIDLLALNVDRITEWLKAKVKSGEFDNTLQQTNDWIVEETQSVTT